VIKCDVCCFVLCLEGCAYGAVLEREKKAGEKWVWGGGGGGQSRGQIRNGGGRGERWGGGAI